MNVDFVDPRNAGVLRYLRNPYDFIVGPKAERFRDARERDLGAGRVRDSRSPDSVSWLNLGTHPDLIERLWRAVASTLPEPAQWVVYGSPVLAHPRTGIVFGWAGGTHTYALRLPPVMRRSAVEAGAQTVARYSNGDCLDVARIGDEWVLGNWLGAEPGWCASAYDHAGSGAT